MLFMTLPRSIHLPLCFYYGVESFRWLDINISLGSVPWTTVIITRYCTKRAKQTRIISFSPVAIMTMMKKSLQWCEALGKNEEQQVVTERQTPCSHSLRQCDLHMSSSSAPFPYCLHWSSMLQDGFGGYILA